MIPEITGIIFSDDLLSQMILPLIRNLSEYWKYADDLTCDNTGTTTMQGPPLFLKHCGIGHLKK